MAERPLLDVHDLEVHFPGRGGLLNGAGAVIRAVDGISFSVARGETLSIVGESGCGKSTTALALMRLLPPTGGTISLGGEDIASLDAVRLKAVRRQMQMVFQDPNSSLNPRQRVRQIVRAPLDIHAIGATSERERRVLDLLQRVGLRPDQAELYPHQLSGGQRQRVGIARALAVEPELLICDEPVSALDVSVQAQILNLFADLQHDLGLSYVFISHDLGVVRHISDRIAVMYRGRIVELASRDQCFAAPAHPYTKLLLGSAPPSHPRLRRGATLGRDENVVGSTGGAGCAFRPRCPIATDRCATVVPTLVPHASGGSVACHNAEVTAQRRSY